MKTIGLLGGMSWESTQGYYRIINQGVKQSLGGLHSARILLYSLDFEDIAAQQRAGDWEAAGGILADAAVRLESAGAEGLLICTNTMHKVAPVIEQAISIPLLHIADATAEALVSQGVTNVGLLGTLFTMEQDFYRGRLHDHYGLNVLIPESEDRRSVNRIIFEELCQGRFEPASKTVLLNIIGKLQKDGADAVILGCTELGMLIEQTDTPVPLLDTTLIHARKAVEFVLG